MQRKSIEKKNKPQIQPIIHIIPQSRPLQQIPLSLPLLTCEPICTLPILARIAVSVRIKIQHGIVRGCSLHLEPCLVVICRDEPLVAIV